MEGIGAEVSQKIRSAIKAKLMEIGVYVDEELPDYVMVMVANKRSREQMDEDLQLFLGKHTPLFTAWLHQVLQKLQEVTVANLGGIKRKQSEDSKKKKKSKQDGEKKESRKKIKIEPEDDNKEDTVTNLKEGDNSKIQKDAVIEEDSKSMTSSQSEPTAEPKRKDKTDITISEESSEYKSCAKNITDISNQSEVSIANSESRRKSEEKTRTGRTKSVSTSSLIEDIDDEDCINIRTDGELLDTAEDHSEEPARKSKEISLAILDSKTGNKSADKKGKTRSSPSRSKSRSKEPINDERVQEKESKKRHTPPRKSPAKVTDKVLDARELLNRKKAAKQSETNQTRSRSRDRSSSPSRKRKNHERDSNLRDTNQRIGREEEKESVNRKGARDEEKDRRGGKERDTYSARRRTEDRPSRRSAVDRADSRGKRKRSNSREPSSKRIMVERPFRNKNSERDSTRPSESNGRRVDMELLGKRRHTEESRKRSGLSSRVVQRATEPEGEAAVDTAMPSVVRVTPRPRRPPSQQPSTNLIMKAISEANKSLATVPQRPDTTQRRRKEPVFTRTLRCRERIPPEKIAVSITNPLALHSEETAEEDKDNAPPLSPINDNESIKSPTNSAPEVTSFEPDVSAQNDINHNEEWEKEIEKMEEIEGEAEIIEETQQLEPEAESTLEPEPLVEPVEEMSDPQFVVTLNGYDPDGLFSQSELDLDEDEWLRSAGDEDPLLTSTPAEVPSPRTKRSVSPTTATVNHSNLIEVELQKPKSVERCKYWPVCRLGEKCTFYHPTKPCKIFPACKFGDACLYIHPQCKFNALCTRTDCVFAHTPALSPGQTHVAAMPKAKALYAASAPLPCRFYPNCANVNCQFAHPIRACRFGLYCTKKDCSFDHGKVAPVDKLKWTRVPPT